MTVDETPSVPSGPLERVAFLPLPELAQPPEVETGVAYRSPDSFSRVADPSIVFLSDQPGLGVYRVGARGQTLLVALPPNEYGAVVDAYGADRRPTQLYTVDAADRQGWQIHEVSTAQAVSALRDIDLEPTDLEAGTAAWLATRLGRLLLWSPASRASVAAALLSRDRPWTDCRAVDLTPRAERAKHWFGVEPDLFGQAFFGRALERTDRAAPLLAYVNATPPAEEVDETGLGPLPDLRFSIPPPSLAPDTPSGRNRWFWYESIARHHFKDVDPDEALALSGPYGHRVDENLRAEWSTTRWFSSGFPFELLWVQREDGTPMLVRLGAMDFGTIIDDYHEMGVLGREQVMVSAHDTAGRPFQATIQASAEARPSGEHRLGLRPFDWWGFVPDGDLETMEEAVRSALGDAELQPGTLLDHPRLKAAAAKTIGPTASGLSLREEPPPSLFRSADEEPEGIDRIDLSNFASGILYFSLMRTMASAAAEVAAKIGWSIPSLPMFVQAPLLIVAAVAVGVYCASRQWPHSKFHLNASRPPPRPKLDRDRLLSDQDRMRLAAVFFCADHPFDGDRVADFTRRLELASKWFGFEMYEPDGRLNPRFLDCCFDYEARRTGGDKRPRFAYVRDHRELPLHAPRFRDHFPPMRAGSRSPYRV